LIDIRHPATTYLEDDAGRIAHERAYRDTTSGYYDFDGTLLADQHGGWGHSKPIVGFHHTLIEITPSALARASGYREGRRTTMGSGWGPRQPSGLGFTSLWQK
jgi:hypothetical protein